MTRLNISRPRAPRARRVATRSDVITVTGEEILTIASIPTTSAVGDLIYVLEVNPTQFPRLAVFASQYKQWKGDLKMKCESLGNAFANSSVSLAFVADPDQSELPVPGIGLVQVADSAPSGCRAQLHLQSTNSALVDAPWKFGAQIWKYCQDTDVSDRASGLFLVVSNGVPGGTAPIPLKITASYRVQFQGNTYAPMESAVATNISALYGVNNALSDNLFTATTGAFNWVLSGPTLTLTMPTGTVSSKYQGVWNYPTTAVWFITVVPASNTGVVSRVNITTMTVTATSVVYLFATAPTTPVGSVSFTITQRVAGQ